MKRLVMLFFGVMLCTGIASTAVAGSEREKLFVVQPKASLTDNLRPILSTNNTNNFGENDRMIIKRKISKGIKIEMLLRPSNDENTKMPKMVWGISFPF